MKPITVNAYTYDELSDRAKENAREWYRESSDSAWINAMITEDFAYALNKLGYPAEDINWSLSYMQGDGVSFYGQIQDLEKVCNNLMPKHERDTLKRKRHTEYGDLSILDMLNIVIYKTNHHYDHWNSMRLADAYEGPSLEIVAQTALYSFLDAIKDNIKEVSRKLEQDGYRILEYHESDERVAESIIANDYLFSEEGSRTICL